MLISSHEDVFLQLVNDLAFAGHILQGLFDGFVIHLRDTYDTVQDIEAILQALANIYLGKALVVHVVVHLITLAVFCYGRDNTCCDVDRWHNELVLDYV